MPPSSYI